MSGERVVASGGSAAPRAALVVACVGTLVAGLAAPAFRDSDGSLSAAFVMSVAVAVGLAAAAWAWGSGWVRSSLWLGLAAMGQAAALQLVDAGPNVGYQHYRDIPELIARPSWAVAVLVVQGAVVGTALLRAWPAIRGWLATNVGTTRLAVILGFVSLVSATGSPSLARFARELGLASVVQLVSLANVVLLVRAAPRLDAPMWRRLLDALWENDERRGTRADAFVIVAGVAVFVFATVLCFGSYDRHPHVPDEVAYLLQARYFAAGLLSLPAPPVPEAFEINLMVVRPDGWFSTFPPGWPALLALGALVHSAWLVNPLLAGLDVLLVFALLVRLYDRRTARLGALLFAVSPWQIFLGMSFMAHAFTLTCALVAGLAVARVRETGRLRWTWLGGLGIGLVGLSRPLEGIAVAVPLGLWALWPKGGRPQWAPAAFLTVVTVLVGALVLPYNRALTGHATEFPVMTFWDEVEHPGANQLGFGPDRGFSDRGLDPFPGHGPRDVLVNADYNLFAMNVELFGWGFGSLLLVAGLVGTGGMSRRDLSVAGAGLFVVAVHSFYWFSGGPDFGARYWYLVIFSAVALTARALTRLALPEGEDAGRAARERVTVAALAATVLALATFVPWRAVDKYPGYRGMQAGVRTLQREYDFGRSLVLVRGRRHPDYASAAIYNPLDLRSDAPVYAWARNAEVTASVLRAYGDRPVWILEGPTVSGRGFIVVDGPLPASEVDPSEVSGF